MMTAVVVIMYLTIGIVCYRNISEILNMLRRYVIDNRENADDGMLRDQLDLKISMLQRFRLLIVVYFAYKAV